MTSWLASSEQGADGIFVYIFFEGVETPEDSEDLRALVESGLVTATLFFRRYELIVALKISDEDHARAMQNILRQFIAGRIDFTLVSRYGNSDITQIWSIPDLTICISLFESDELGGAEIARRIRADNPRAAVDVVRRVGDEQSRNVALVQVAGRERSEVMLQLSRAIAAARITPALSYFSPTPEERARRAAGRQRPGFDNLGDDSEGSVSPPSLRRIAERRGISLDEAVHAAGQTLDWIDSQVADGGRFVLMRNRKRYRVRFPR